MATFIEMIEAAEGRVQEYRLIADNEEDGVVFEEGESADRLLAAVLAVESRLEWLGLMLAPLIESAQTPMAVTNVVKP